MLLLILSLTRPQRNVYVKWAKFHPSLAKIVMEVATTAPEDPEPSPSYATWLADIPTIPNGASRADITESPAVVWTTTNLKITHRYTMPTMWSKVREAHHVPETYICIREFVVSLTMIDRRSVFIALCLTPSNKLVGISLGSFPQARRTRTHQLGLQSISSSTVTSSRLTIVYMCQFERNMKIREFELPDSRAWGGNSDLIQMTIRRFDPVYGQIILGDLNHATRFPGAFKGPCIIIQY